MKERRRTIHPEERSTHPDILAGQRRMLAEFWYNDVEFYDDEGNLVAVTSRSNPNFERLAANLSEFTPGDPK